MSPPSLDAARMAGALLGWYDRHRRVLPWRAPPGVRPDPYRVWLSEVMLQQTTVATVKPYFEAFLRRWPSVRALAAASLDEVLHAWQGMGYYARARNLHKCARLVSAEHGGRFPDTEAGLRALPGIGDYTAAAVAAIAFGRQATAMDANAERVLARLHGVVEPLPGAKRTLKAHAAALTPAARAGDYAQGVMDLGATICTPRRPACALCPWRPWCAAQAAGLAEDLPRRAPARVRPLRRAVAYWARRADGAVLLRRRPEEGLLGGMMEVPSTAWRARVWSAAEARRHAPFAAPWRRLAGTVRHGFTHLEIEFAVLAARADGELVLAGVWCPIDRLGEYALPSMTKKIVAHALAREPAAG